jgi:hypothetical protein
MALQPFVGPWPLFQLLDPMHSRQDSLDGEPVAGQTPAHRINAHNIDIHAFSVIRTHDPSVQASEESSCLKPRGCCDRRDSIL